EELRSSVYIGISNVSLIETGWLLVLLSLIVLVRVVGWIVGVLFCGAENAVAAALRRDERPFRDHGFRIRQAGVRRLASRRRLARVFAIAFALRHGRPVHGYGSNTIFVTGWISQTTGILARSFVGPGRPPWAWLASQNMDPWISIWIGGS